jgi:hypothetical protein
MNRKRTKSLVAIASLLVLFALGNQAFATENAIDVVPAGTLLLPYFEVDLNNPGGLTTLFSVNNASAAPQLAHITFWTDQSRPTLDFTIYLTGYDVWTINLGPLFRQGAIPLLVNPPKIGGPKQAPAATDEDAGAFSVATGAPAIAAGEGAACTFPLPPTIPASFLSFIQRVHTGLTAPAGFAEAGRCGAAVFGDNHARGYVTIDVVRNCSPLVPSSPGYFSTILAGADPDPIGAPPGTANTIWGDWFLVDPANDFAQGDTLVHIEAYRDPGTALPGDYTFYGRYNDFTAVDNREPLATVWGARYAVGGAFDGTDLLCWRDTGAEESSVYYAASAGGVCPGRPPVSGTGADGQPLGQNQLVIFDEEENPIEVETPPFSPIPVGETLTPCPWEANRTAVGGPSLPTGAFQFGWLYLNLNTTNAFSEFPPDTLQSWVGVLFQASGRFSVGLQGVHFDHATDPRDCIIGDRGSVICNGQLAQ